MDQERRKVNYTGIREGLISGDCLEGDCLEALVSIGLDYSSELIRENEAVFSGFQKQTPEFQKYLSEAVLWRMIRMYKSAVRDGMVKAGSINLFARLKTKVSAELGLQEKSLPDELLSDLFTRGLDEFHASESSSEVMKQMDLVRNYTSQVVSDNPKKEIKLERHILD